MPGRGVDLLSGPEMGNRRCFSRFRIHGNKIQCTVGHLYGRKGVPVGAPPRLADAGTVCNFSGIVAGGIPDMDIAVGFAEAVQPDQSIGNFAAVGRHAVAGGEPVYYRIGFQATAVREPAGG